MDAEDRMTPQMASRRAFYSLSYVTFPSIDEKNLVAPHGSGLQQGIHEK